MVITSIKKAANEAIACNGSAEVKKEAHLSAKQLEEMIIEVAYHIRKAKGFRSDPKVDWAEAIARIEALS